MVSGMTSPWLHSTLPSGSVWSRSSAPSKDMPSARTGEGSTLPPTMSAMGSSVCMQRTYGLDSSLGMSRPSKAVRSPSA
jgi:hypothetical protein